MTTLNGSSVICTLPVPVSLATRSRVRSKLSGQAEAMHACCAAAGFGGVGGGGFVVVGADATGLPCSEKRYTPLLRLRLPTPGSRIPATAMTSLPTIAAPPATPPLSVFDHKTSPV